jgi:hypothetical protein
MAYVDDLENVLTPARAKILHTIPNSDFPPYLIPTPVSAERLKKIERVKKPAGTELFWNSILSGGLGTTQPKLLKPDFSEFVQYKKQEIGGKESHDMDVEPKE